MFRRRTKLTMLATLAAAAALTVGGLVVNQQQLIAQNVAEAAKFTPKPAVTATAETINLKVAPFQAAADKLRTTDEPFTLTVVGDSTGFAEQSWLVTSLRDINRATGRAIELHTWNSEDGKYDPPRTIGEGAPTLTVWNGSAPGKDAAYSVQRLGVLIPKTPDLLVINHGHNVTLTSSVRALLVQASAKAGPKTAVAIMKQNPQSGTGQSFQANRMAFVEATAKEFKGVQLIDAYAAFDLKNPKLLMGDGVHPTAEGYRLWANVFLQRLGFA